ncbi:hypothetical protein LX32DRAFT_442300 [Colletotrichum zoysiae]|uniref:Uncharacterized protein n=1 Tax=Colletotrichum zoysiae TaxID=1216348 RepID=A0AAD9HTD1_9PEZI|nr:hypothetical protein LX32DRAFT_442300 [Colletotrichum zoysiae]
MHEKTKQPPPVLGSASRIWMDVTRHPPPCSEWPNIQRCFEHSSRLPPANLHTLPSLCFTPPPLPHPRFRICFTAPRVPAKRFSSSCVL